MVDWFVLVLAGLIIAQRLLEMVVAQRNRQWLLALGAVEYGARHYPLFFLLHGAWFVGWITEAFASEPALSTGWPIWLVLFFTAQILRYWCIRSLGRCWNTRILVVPGATKVCQGPYRYLPHPNYVAVAAELLAVPMLFGCWLTALMATTANGILLLGFRIPQEEAALRLLRQ